MRIDDSSSVLIMITACVFLVLIITSALHYLKFTKRYREELASWQTLCEGIKGIELLRASSFSSAQHWRYLRMNTLSKPQHLQASAEDRLALKRGELIYPQWIQLGQGSAPLLCVTYLPSPQQLLPSSTLWGAVAPGLSTMVGVLGTFLGIQYGLSESNLGASVMDTGQTTAQISALMGGASILFNSMSFAFITSLGGLTTAIITTILSLSTQRARVSACRELAQLQDERFCVRSAAQSIQQLSEDLSQLKVRQSESIESLQSRLEQLSQESLLNHGNQQELIAELMVQIDDLLSFHLPRDPH